MNDLINSDSDKFTDPEWAAIEDADGNGEVPFFGEQTSENENQQTDEEIKAEQEKEEARIAAMTDEEKAEHQKELDAKEETARIAAMTDEEKATYEKEQKEELEAKQTEEKKTADAKLREEIRQDLLKELNITSVDDIKKLTHPEAPLTDEQKHQQAQEKIAAFTQYAVRKKVMGLDEIDAFKTASQMPPQDLVYARFASEYKDANKDRKGTDGTADPVTDEEMKDMFDRMFHIGSEDPFLKKTGESAIKAQAAEMLAEPKKKYDTALQQFEQETVLLENMPRYKQFISNILDESIPKDNMVIEVAGKKINVALDGKDREEIETDYKNDLLFNEYMKAADRQGLKTNFIKSIERKLAKKYETIAANEIFEAGKSEGLKKGVIGARVPFTPPSGSNQPASTSGKLTPEERANNRAGLNKF